MKHALIVLSFALLPLPLQAATTQLDTASANALQTAIAAAAPGDVLILPDGDYGALDLDGLHMPQDQPLTLRGEGTARISGMLLHDVQGLVLDRLVFDYSYSPGDDPKLRPFQINGSQGIVVANSLFDGDVARGVGPEADGFGTGFGLGLRGSQGITVQGNEIRGFFRGLTANDCADLVVQGNDIHSLRMDGMNFAQVQRVLIAGNHIHDFLRSATSRDHADMIQFWTADTTAPSVDITIRDNLLNSGGGLYTQSIFMRNERVDTGDAGDEMFYRNITIENNLIINAHAHGITLGATEGLLIANNSLIHNAASDGARNNPRLWTPRINVAEIGRDVQILRNVAAQIVGYENQSGWTLADNLEVQDRAPDQPGYYSAVFANPTGNPADPASFAALPGGPLDHTGIGADLN